ncbi:MAG TPA: sensor histidine kinase [Flavisolibacter sp.]|nr:sensor histidine kinase [Flavisolibacter sp.]
MKLFSKYPNNKKSAVSMGTVHINMGLVHNGNNDYETAIYYYLKAEEIYRKYDPQNGDLAVLYSNLSITYGSINKHLEGLTYSKKGLDFARKTNDKVSLMNSYYAYGGNLVNAKQSDNGLVYLDSAKALGIELNNLYYIYSSDFMKGLYYYKTNQFEKAKAYYTICLDFARKYQSTPDMGNNYLNIAAIELNLKRPQSAKVFLDSARKFLDLSVASFSKKEYFENYAEMCNQLGDHTKAFAYKDSATAMKDSLYQADNIKQTEFRQARYNYEKQESEIDRLESEKKIQELTLRQRRTTMIVLAGGILALLITGYFGYRNYRQKQKLQQQRISELETEKQLAATEAVLKGEEQERTRLAKDLHDGLGGMLSGIKYSLNTMKGNLIMTPENAQAFERSMDLLDSSIKEMRRVAHNMMPEALVKFGLDTALKDFCNDVSNSGALTVNYQSINLGDKNIDQTTAITIYRIVQELLNNTMKHAAAKNAIVQLSSSNGQLSLTVEDDGKGFDTAILKQSKGIGWDNIQNRVEFLKGKMDVASSPGKGTSVHIELAS